MANTIEIKITANNASTITAIRQIVNAFKSVGDTATAAGEKIKSAGNGDPFAGAKTSGSGFLDTLSKIGMSLFGIVETFRMAGDVAEKFFGTGLRYDQQMETARMGVAGILMSMTTWNGEQLKLNQAMEISQKTLDQIQEQAVKIGLVPQDLITGFQAILGPGLQAKMTLEEIVQLTTMGTKAVKAMLGPQGNDIQVAQELRSMVSGNVDQNSTVSRALGITNADVERAKQSAGGLFAYLKEQLGGFKELANEAWPNSMTGIIEQFRAKFSQAAGGAEETIFEEVKAQIKDLNNSLFVTDEQTKKVSFNPELLSDLKSFVDYTIIFANKIEYIGSIIIPGIGTPLNAVGNTLKFIIDNIYGVTTAILTWNAIQKAIDLFNTLNAKIVAAREELIVMKTAAAEATAATAAGANTAAVSVGRIEAAAFAAKTAIRGLASATLWGAIAVAAGIVVEKIIDNFNKIDKWKQDREQAQQTNKGSDGSISWLLANHEGGGADYDAASTGENDPRGGPSYGRYQFSTYQGVASAFVDWLISEGWDVGSFLKYSEGSADEWGNYYPGHEVTPGTDEFAERWHEAMKKYGNDFADLQDTYARMMYYDPARDYLTANQGLDPNARSNAVQAAIFSTAIQHGTGGMVDVFNRAAQDYGVYNLSYLNDDDLLRAIYQSRAELNPSDTARYNDELQEALSGLQKNTPPSRSGASGLGLKNPPQDAEDLAKAQVALANAIANDQLQEYIADLKNQEQALENKYSKTNAGTASPDEMISAADYIQQKKDIATAQTNAEIAYIQKQIDEKTGLLSNRNLSQADRVNTQADIEKLKSSITQKQEELKTTLDALDNANDTAVQALKDEASDVAATNLENKSDIVGAEQLRLQKQNRAQMEKFSANNMPDAQKALKENADYALSVAKFNQSQKNLEIANGEMVDVQQNLFNDLAKGSKSAAEITQEYIDQYNAKVKDEVVSLQAQLEDAVKSGHRPLANEIRDALRKLNDTITDSVNAIIQRIDADLQNEIAKINADHKLTELQKQDKIDEATSAAYSKKATEYDIAVQENTDKKNFDAAKTAQNAADLNRRLAEMPNLLDKVHEAARQGFEDGLLDFLERGIIECKNLGEAFRNLAITVLESINKIYSQQLTKQIMGMFGLGGSSSPKSVLGTTASNGFYYDPNFGFKPVINGGFSEGGEVEGPGTETSDSILSLLSRKEFVIKASSVRKYGANFLHQLNSGLVPRSMLPRFASGGLVGARSNSIPGPHELAASLVNNNNTTVPLSIMNILDPNVMGRFMQTREGKKALLNYIKNDAVTIKRVLNITR